MTRGDDKGYISACPNFVLPKDIYYDKGYHVQLGDDEGCRFRVNARCMGLSLVG